MLERKGRNIKTNEKMNFFFFLRNNQKIILFYFIKIKRVINLQNKKNNFFKRLNINNYYLSIIF